MSEEHRENGAETKCRWCGCVGYHSEVCEGFEVNDPARMSEEHLRTRDEIAQIIEEKPC